MAEGHCHADDPGVAMVHIDHEQRLREACREIQRLAGHGDLCPTERLLAEHPDLAQDEDAALELIYAEYTAREESGETVDEEELARRFPQWEQRIRNLFRVHHALEDNVIGPASAAWPTDQFDTTQHRPAKDSVDRDVGKSIARPAARDAIGQYRLLELIGRGGAGLVYRARQAGLERDVAIKVLPRSHFWHDAAARFAKEAKAVAQLQHPQIVQVFDFGQDGECLFLAMEYVPGGSLDRHLDHATIPIDEACSLLTRLADGIQYAHECGVIHRDLKPANVLLTAGGQPKIADFGLAKCLERDDPASQLTESGTLLGTPGYMAPEQTVGAAVGVATDVYGLGAILYEMLTGRPPFQGPSPLDTLQQIRQDEPVPPRQWNTLVPRDLDTICLKCLEKDPAHRYSSARDLADDVRRFQRGEPVVARPLSTLSRALRWSRRNPLPALLSASVGTLLVVLGIGGMAVGWTQARLREKAERETIRALRARHDAQQSAEEAKTVTDYLVDAFRSADPTWHEPVSLQELLANAIATLDERFTDDSPSKPSLLLALAKTQIGLGAYNRAVELAERAWQLRIRQSGPESIEALEAATVLGDAYNGAGRSKEALDLLERTTQQLQRTVGDDDPATLQAMVFLAGCYDTSEKLQESSRLLEHVHRHRVKELGPDNPLTINVLVTLTNSYRRQGQAQRSIDVLEDRLAAVLPTLGPSHMSVCELRSSLAEAYMMAGQFPAARLLYEQVHQALQQRLGDSHPHTWGALYNMAVVDAELGEYERSRDTLTRVLNWRREHLGADHPATLYCMHNLAVAQSFLGESEAARDLLHETWQRRRDVLGDDNMETLETQLSLGLELRRLRQWDDALDILMPLYQRITATLPPDHPLVMGTMSALGTAWHGKGEVEQAIDIQKQLVERAIGTMGRQHPHTCVYAGELAKSYLTTRQYESAVELLRTNADLSLKVHGRDHPQFAIAQFNLGKACVDAGQSSEAQRVLLPLLHEKYQSINGGMLAAETHCLLGTALLDLGELPEAERHLLVGYKALSTGESSTLDLDVRCRRYAASLARLYEVLEKPAEADEWRKLAGP